jgi:hypothetical protein
MEARAEELVDQHWPTIESVASALLKHGVVAGDIRTGFPPPAVVRRRSEPAERGRDQRS